MYLLDANVCIAWLRRSNALVIARIHSTPPIHLNTSAIVLAELYYGAQKSANPVKNTDLIDKLKLTISSLPFDGGAAEVYDKLRQELSSRGMTIGSNDMLIAATALRYGLSLVTNNTAEFSRVSGLIIEDWH